MAAGDPGTLKRNYTATAIETSLSAAIAASTQGGTTTSFIVVSNSGYPTTYPFTLIVDPDTSKEEVITVNSGAGTTYSVTRGQDNTQAVAHSAGVVVRHGVSAREFKELQTHIAARGYDVDSGILSNVDTHVHGIATGDGVIVGTLKAQTLTQKTLTTPTINGATISGAFTSTATITGGTYTAGTVTSSTIRTSTFTSGTVTSSTITSGTLGSDLSAGTTYKITNLADPASNQDAATKKYVDDRVAALIASAPGTLDTLDELAAALGDDPNYATTISTALGTKLNLSGGTMTGAIAMGANKITGTYTPSAAADLTTKSYIDGLYGDTASAALSATSAANSATSSANSATASATSASASATRATASASSASASATSATLSASSASASATSATASASSATASATSAVESATSATSSANSATASATSATASASSASAAATSASNAASSATAAANSASAAATSASDAAATYDNFDDRYLGSKSTAPSVDNDGNTLLVGAIYWDSAQSKMFVWSGSAWVQIATTTVYSAPTLGSTTLASGTTYSTITGLTLSGGLAAADPSTALGIATKQYVDTLAAGVNFHPPVKAATTTNLNVTYSNGTSGVGATLTADTLRAFNTLDGQSVSVGERVLIKDQTNQTQNGIYTLTNNGSAGVTAWVLTRATDQDNSTPGEIANGDVIFAVGGTVNQGKTFVNSSVGTITIGTTDITYANYYAGLPAQAGNNGYYLTTDGTTPSWAAVNLSAYALASTENDNTILALMGAY